MHIKAEAVAEGHLGEGLPYAAEAQGPAGNDMARFDLNMDIAPELLERIGIGHTVRQRRVPQQVNAVARLLEFGRDDPRGTHRRDAEGDERRGHVNLLEGAAHGVLATDGRQAEGQLHVQGTQQGRQRLAPGMGIVRHPLEIFLVGESHRGPVATGSHHLGTSLHHGISSAVIRAPAGQVRVVAEGHHAGRVGLAGHGQLLHRDLRLRILPAAAIGHQHRGAADGGVKHLDQALLRSHVGRGQQRFQTCPKVVARHRNRKGIAVLHRQDGRLRIVARTGAVDEAARQVGHTFRAVQDPHAARVRDVGHIGHFDVLFGAIAFKTSAFGRRNHHGHALLRLADGELHRIQAAVFRGDAVEVDLQAVGQFADRHAHATRAKVVRFLDEPRHFRPAEEPLELALLGGIALLDFAAAGGQRGVRMAFRGTCGAADAVAARASAEQQDHVARRGAFAQHLGLRNGAHHCTDLHALGGIAFVEDLPHMRGCQADLIAIARIAGRRLARNHALRQLAVQGLGNGLPDVTGTRHAHRLVYIGTAREGVADGAAQAGGRTAERLDLRGVVVGLVLELQQPLLGLAVDIHVDDDAAGIVLFALLLVVQHALVLEVAGADGGQFHEAERFVVASELVADGFELAQIRLEGGFDEGIVHADVRQLGGEGRVAAVVAPVGVEDAQLRLGRVTALLTEVQHHLAQVVGVHGQAPVAAEGGEVGLGHVGESIEGGQRPDSRGFLAGDDREVFLAALHGVDEIAAHGGHPLVGEVVVEDQQAAAADVHLRGGVDEVHAVQGRGGALVELARDELHGQVAAARQVEVIDHRVGHAFAEHRIAALLQQLVGKAA